MKTVLPINLYSLWCLSFPCLERRISLWGQNHCPRASNSTKKYAEDPHPITGHGENVLSPAKKVKVSFQAPVQGEIKRPVAGCVVAEILRHPSNNYHFIKNSEQIQMEGILLNRLDWCVSTFYRSPQGNMRLSVLNNRIKSLNNLCRRFPDKWTLFCDSQRNNFLSNYCPSWSAD